MPAILDPETYQAWISPETDTPAALELLERNLGPQLQYYRVSTTRELAQE